VTTGKDARVLCEDEWVQGSCYIFNEGGGREEKINCDRVAELLKVGWEKYYCLAMMAKINET